MGWIKAISSKHLNDKIHCYHGTWNPEMDRCWIREEDGLCVQSRLIRVPEAFGGKVEHVTITKKGLSTDGSGGLTWAEKQQIKDELFGENRTAVEVFPKQKMLVDVCDVYHLWVFDKKFELPFGIHPKQYTKAINRGYNITPDEMCTLQAYYKKRDELAAAAKAAALSETAEVTDEAET